MEQGLKQYKVSQRNKYVVESELNIYSPVVSEDKHHLNMSMKDCQVTIISQQQEQNVEPCCSSLLEVFWIAIKFAAVMAYARLCDR